MKKEKSNRTKKHPVPYQEFERLMRGIREQTRNYPQEALEEIFVHLDMIEKKYGIPSEEDQEVID